MGPAASGGALGEGDSKDASKDEPLLQGGGDIEQGAGGSDPDDELTAEDMLSSADSFVTLISPVFTTMVLASLAVVYINDGANGGTTYQGLTTLPVIYKEDGTGTTGEQLGHALVNALLIVGIVIGFTTLLVVLYYYKCMKIIIGWLLLSTGMLLGLSTQYMVQIGLAVYSVPTDMLTYYFFFWNYAVVGTMAIFYEGIFGFRAAPMYVTQTYLVFVSVAMSWLLLRFLPQWTSWSLLVLLAFYDLCAVLTPCGPLKFLVEMAQNRDDPLPGLLYEAEVKKTATSASGKSPPPPPPKPQQMRVSSSEEVHPGGKKKKKSRRLSFSKKQESASEYVSLSNNSGSDRDSPAPKDISVAAPPPEKSDDDDVIDVGYSPPTVATPPRSSQGDGHTQVDMSSSSTTKEIPLRERDPEAYKREQARLGALLYLSKPLSEFYRSIGQPGKVANVQDLLVYHADRYGPERGKEVLCEKLKKKYGENATKTFIWKTYRTGTRIGNDDQEYELDRSVKLGLGDFVFYSVLSGRAALNGFTELFVVYLAIMMGLGMTIVCLSVFKKALPALPFSIIFGVGFYFATRAIVVPLAYAGVANCVVW